MSAENKSLLRHIYQSDNLDMANVETKYHISKLFVKKCFESIQRNCDLASKCVSKQIETNNWIVT